MHDKLAKLRSEQQRVLLRPASSRQAGTLEARQREWATQIDEMYSELTAEILVAAADCSPRKRTPSLQGGLRTRPRSEWRPDADWHKLKHNADTEWLKHKEVPHDHVNKPLSEKIYRQACSDLRIHTSQSRASWLSQRLQKTSLHASPHKIKLTWAKLKRSLGTESTSGLPAQVRGDDDSVLQGEQATAEWHKKRAACRSVGTTRCRVALPYCAAGRTGPA